MDNYTKLIELKNMFDTEFYEILKKANINVSNYTFEYLTQISNDEIKKLNFLVKYYGDKKRFNLYGKDKLISESINIRELAESWVKKRRNNPNIKVPSLLKILDENINYINEIEVENLPDNSEKNDSSNKKSEIVVKSNYSHLTQEQIKQKQQELEKISITNITNVNNKNYQLDLFALEFPIFSLKLNKKQTDFEFTSKNNATITLRSTSVGRATIQDSDIWLYCISKLMQLIFEKKINTRKIEFTGYDFLKTTGRTISGANYEQIIKSLKRLASTTLETNKTIGYWEVGAGLGLLDSYQYIKDTRNGKLAGIEVVLPQWLYCEIIEKKVAKINPEYFKLTPLQKRLYHLAKRHCRNEKSYQPFDLDYFAQKIGSNAKLRFFRKNIKKISEIQPLPEYLIEYDKDTDKVKFLNRNQDMVKIAKEQKLKVKSIQFKHLLQNKANPSDKISNENFVKIKNFIEVEFGEKKYPIFQTKILSDEKLKQYLKKFKVNYIIEKIISIIDFDFNTIKNPEGYFWGILEKNHN